MFDSRHYVPVMRMKRAELAALSGLDPSLRACITPLLECPPSRLGRDSTSAQVEEQVDGFASFLNGWSGRSVFLDFRDLPQSLSHALSTMAARVAQDGVRPILTVSLKADLRSAYTNAVLRSLDRGHGSGLCLRLSPEELKCSCIEEMVHSCLRHYGTAAATVDLVIDRQFVDSGSVTYEDVASLIPSQAAWRTLTVVAGSFPEDLSRLSRGRAHMLRRPEWEQWQALRSWKGRRPAFGDYTIQHVLFKEPVPLPNVSASVRYTLENQYLVLRGEGINNVNGPGAAQWNAWAVLLSERDEYFGAGFSAGDRYIAERAVAGSATGNPTTWLEAGFSHHMTVTALQVAGWLSDVRRLTATARSESWSSAINISEPPAMI